MGRMNRRFLGYFLMFATGAVFGQAGAGPQEGGNEVQVWAGGGHSVPGGTQNTEAFDSGLRYGWVITGAHLPWFLRGRFEYTVDAVPVYLFGETAIWRCAAGLFLSGLKVR